MHGKNNVNFSSCEANYVDSALSLEIENVDLPSPELVMNAIHQSNFDMLRNVLVVPGNNRGLAIKFEDDTWTTKHLAREDESYRMVCFSKLPYKIKNEIKVIGLYLIWFNPKGAKLSSIIRIIEKLATVSSILAEMKANSFFWLDREPIRQRFISELSIGRRAGTIDGYLKSISRVCDMKHTFFKEVGYFLDFNFSTISPGRRDNQTYCMPIRILGLYWKSYIDFFDDFNVKLDNWKYVSRLPKRYKEYIKENNIKDHNNNWLYYVDEFCQDSLRDIYFDKNCKVSEIIIRRSDDDVRDYENNNYTYQKIVGGRLVDVPLARTSYNRRFPQYYVDIEQIYIFYHRAALIACETIQSMTGMRLSESNAIKFGALIDENGWVGVKSRLFKYAGEGGVEEWWAASPYIKIVFSKVRGLAKALFNVEEYELDYLYIKTDARHFINHREFRLMKTQRNSEKVMNWTERNNIYITEEDTEEFWKLNPNIAEPEYVESVIYPGAKWPVTPHQFRRSIAVHVRRLELVTMRQLASHLKHLGKTLADWYSDGSTESSMLTGKISSAFAKELERADLEIAATMAMKFQNGNNLFGRGGEILEKQKHVDSKLKTYQSYQQAKSLAKRRKSKLVSLGNGMYCMNGTECDFKAVSQSANCRPDCENLVADKDSIPIWKRRYEKFRLLYLQSIEDGKPEASREFFRLEMESYKQALEFYGIIL